MQSLLIVLVLLVLSCSHALPQDQESAEHLGIEPHGPIGHYFDQFLAMFYQHSHGYEDGNIDEGSGQTDCKNETKETSTATSTTTKTTIPTQTEKMTSTSTSIETQAPETSSTTTTETTTTTAETTTSTESTTTTPITTTTTTTTTTTKTTTTTPVTTATTTTTTTTTTTKSTTETTTTTAAETTTSSKDTTVKDCEKMSYTLIPDEAKTNTSRDTEYWAMAEEEGREIEKRTFCDKMNEPHTSPYWNGEGWYKFQGRADRNLEIMEMHPLGPYCGTEYPGYIAEIIDTDKYLKVGEEARAKVCFSKWENECDYEVEIKILFCGGGNPGLELGGVFLYYLKEAPACPLRYCVY